MDVIFDRFYNILENLRTFFFHPNPWTLRTYWIQNSPRTFILLMILIDRLVLGLLMLLSIKMVKIIYIIIIEVGITIFDSFRWFFNWDTRWQCNVVDRFSTTWIPILKISTTEYYWYWMFQLISKYRISQWNFEVYFSTIYI